MDNQKQQTSNDPGQMLPPIQPPPMTDGAGTDGLPPLQNEQIPPEEQGVPAGRALVPVPDAASDDDLIEKEWVEKAKQIVDHTAEDPFLQQQELSKMKADYMKKRYNKDVGVT